MLNYFLQYDRTSNRWKVWSVIDKNKIPKTVPEDDRYGISYEGHKKAIEVANLRNKEIEIVEETIIREEL